MKQKVTILLSGVALCLSLSAQQNQPDTHLARVYVYVNSDAVVRSWRPVFCDGTLAAEVKRGKFFVINLAAGRHMLSDRDGIPAFIDVRSDEEYFVRLKRSAVMGPSSKSDVSVLTIVRPADAKEEVRYLTYIDTKKMHSQLVSKKDPTTPSLPRLNNRTKVE